jgi:hypothetical protein
VGDVADEDNLSTLVDTWEIFLSTRFSFCATSLIAMLQLLQNVLTKLGESFKASYSVLEIDCVQQLL